MESTSTKDGSLNEYDNINLFIEKENSTTLIAEPKISNKATFQTFIKEFENTKFDYTNCWNKERGMFMKDELNKKKIMLKEINQFDYKVYN
jgi:hypothetical protein